MIRGDNMTTDDEIKYKYGNQLGKLGLEKAIDKMLQEADYKIENVKKMIDSVLGIEEMVRVYKHENQN